MDIKLGGVLCIIISFFSWELSCAIIAVVLTYQLIKLGFSFYGRMRVHMQRKHMAKRLKQQSGLMLVVDQFERKAHDKVQSMEIQRQNQN